MGRRVYQISTVIYSFFYLNVLWCFFTLLGGGVFGLFPATLTVYTMLRCQLTTGEWVVSFREFWLIYRSNFRPMIKPALLMYGVGYVLLLNNQYLEGLAGRTLGYISLLLGLLFVAYCLIFFPVHAHFKLSFKEGMQKPFYVLMANPVLGMVSILMFLFSEWAVIHTAGVFLLFVISVPAYVCMRLYWLYFEKLMLKGM